MSVDRVPEPLEMAPTLLSAASRTRDAGAKVVFIARARNAIETARARVAEFDALCAAAEAEMARTNPVGQTADLPGIGGTGGSCSSTRKP